MKIALLGLELFLTFLTGLIWAAAFLHLMVGVIEIAALLGGVGG